MSLQYIIDGYNIIHHANFIRQTHKKTKEPRLALLELIKIKALGGSSNNKITVVFDGYPSLQDNRELNYDPYINIIFSRSISADEKIRMMVEDSANRKNIMVVSDDKEIKFAVRLMGARQMGIEDFLAPKPKSQRQNKKETLKPELTYTQMHKINQELRKIWLSGT